MKYMIGYQIRQDDGFVREIIKNKDHIYEVYFSWADFPNGRNNQLRKEGFTPWEAQAKQMSDVALLSQNGLKLNLLLNGNCYGRNSQSREFFNKVGETVDFISGNYGLQSVTTTSPLIAKFIHNNFEEIEVRASVNMSIGTVEGMDYMADVFDSFYMQREYNRNLEKIKELKSWCDQNDKKLFMLANSGCLNNCSAHTFHDNLVSHESDISAMDNGYDFQGACWEYLSKADKKEKYLSITNFVRPEDIHLYEHFFEAAKLATRVNSNPVGVLNAYIKGKHSGNVMDLLEPNHSGVWYPYVVENSKILDGFAEHVLNCDKNCFSCNYCKDIYEKAIINLEDIGSVK